jgi:acetyl esterase
MTKTGLDARRITYRLWRLPRCGTTPYQSTCTEQIPREIGCGTRRAEATRPLTLGGMADLDLRVRAFGWMLRRLPGTVVSRMTPDDIERANARRISRNRLIDAVFGGIAPSVAVTDMTTDGPEGPIPLRAYRPTQAGSDALPLILNYHGGGFCLGNLDMADWLCSEVAAGVQAVVVSVAYRLAPKHPFPAAVDDSYSALEWAANHAGDLGGDGSRVAVMGDSAGGNLAAVMCLLARDRSGPVLAHQTLIYPRTVVGCDRPSMLRYRKTPLVTLEDIRAFTAYYLGDDGDVTDWRVSPLRASDHTGLPPALVQIAEFDAFYDDALAYAEALRAAGAPVTLTVYGGMPHGYLSIPGVCRGARQALAEIIAEQRRVLHWVAPRDR